jgi:hypothetical protein
MPDHETTHSCSKTKFPYFAYDKCDLLLVHSRD